MLAWRPGARSVGAGRGPESSDARDGAALGPHLGRGRCRPAADLYPSRGWWPGWWPGRRSLAPREPGRGAGRAGGSPFLRRPGPSARPPPPPPRRRPVGARGAPAPSRRRGPSSPVPPTHPGRVRARPPTPPHRPVREPCPSIPTAVSSPAPSVAAGCPGTSEHRPAWHPGFAVHPRFAVPRGGKNPPGTASPCPWRVPVSRLSWHSRWVRGVGVRLPGAAFPSASCSPFGAAVAAPRRAQKERVRLRCTGACVPLLRALGR